MAAVADVPVGGGIVLADQDLVVTQPVAGTFKGFSATCTHQGCKVKEVVGGTINCPCHGSKFAVADGTPTAGPAKKPLPEKAVAVDGSSVVLAYGGAWSTVDNLRRCNRRRDVVTRLPPSLPETRGGRMTATGPGVS